MTFELPLKIRRGEPGCYHHVKGRETFRETKLHLVKGITAEPACTYTHIREPSILSSSVVGLQQGTGNLSTGGLTLHLVHQPGSHPSF